MKEMIMTVEFDIKGLEGSKVRFIPGIKHFMQSELMKAYSVYAEKANSGITDKLNEDWNRLYPSYFEDNKDKEWYDLTEYNEYMAEGYTLYICSNLNSDDEYGNILGYYVDPDEVVFTGYLKADPNVTIQVYLKDLTEA